VLGALALFGPKGQPAAANRDDAQSNRDRTDRDAPPRDKDRRPPDDAPPKDSRADKAADKDKAPGPPLPKPDPDFAKKIGMKFVWIEPGTFLMGSPDGKTPPGVPVEKDRWDDETAHVVTLTRGYYLAATTVTQYQWEQVMGKDAHGSRRKGKDDEEKKLLPVEGVSFVDCQAFCLKLGLRDGKRYTLPTEAEWECACRAGAGTAYCFGDDQRKLGDYAWFLDNAGQEPHEVGTKKPNRWGLYDMHGNVWQWCEDFYAPYPKEKVTDPVNLNSSGADFHVQRGGSLSNPSPICRAAYRGGKPVFRTDAVGCRVVRRLD
jgi:formylglycine-generating enzyme required for sulfatase activity